MRPAKPASAPQLFTRHESALDPEFDRVLRTGDPGPALDGPLTFLPAANSTPAAWLQTWRAWRHETFAATVVPALMSAATHAEHGRAREIQTLDLALDAALDPATRARSVAAGGRLLRRLAVSRGERWLARLAQAHAAGRTPAHFATVYAAQNALFHLPRRLLVQACAYWEWCAAMSALPPVGGPAPEFAGEADELCRLAQESLSLPSSYAVERNFLASAASGVS